MNSKKISLIIFLPLLLFSLSACSLSTTSSSKTANPAASGPDLGGVFVSTDRGVNFKQQASTPTVSGMPGSLNSLSVRTIAQDPSDSNAVYFGSYEKGLFYTYNISNGWNDVKTFPRVTVTAIAVNPENKCDIYATFANRLLRSLDCARTWKQIYLDADDGAIFNTLVIDYYNPSNLYLGTSRGDILKSIDGGNSWRVLKRLTDGVSKIVLSPRDSRQVFVATRGAKIFSFTTDTNTNPRTSANIEVNFSVDNWTDLNAVLKDLKIGDRFVDLVIAQSDAALFLATDSTIVKSVDKGISWQKLSLLPSEKDGIIRAIAVNPQDTKQLYYATDLTFFRSVDGGVTWSNKKLPTSRAASYILVDYKNPNNVYLGVKEK